MTTRARPSLTEVKAELSRFFKRNGYVRRQNRKRLSRDGHKIYKKGDEVRLTAKNLQELLYIDALATQAGFRTGEPFIKGRQYRLPIYGREAVQRFFQVVGGLRNPEPGGAPNPDTATS
jgi:hypothetical protein